jgi:hypothetical protein
MTELSIFWVLASDDPGSKQAAAEIVRKLVDCLESVNKSQIRLGCDNTLTRRLLSDTFLL